MFFNDCIKKFFIKYLDSAPIEYVSCHKVIFKKIKYACVYFCIPHYKFYRVGYKFYSDSYPFPSRGAFLIMKKDLAVHQD